MLTNREQLCSRKGIVKRVDGDNVIVLLEYNDEGESALCSISKDYWRDQDIDIGQTIQVTWDEENIDNSMKVEVISFNVDNTPSQDIFYAENVLGLDPEEKLLIIVGPLRIQHYQKALGNLRIMLRERLNGRESNKEEREEVEKSLEEIDRAIITLPLKSAPWGEFNTYDRFILNLLKIGFQRKDIKDIKGIPPRDFKPKEYADTNIIFIGSPKSNEILREHYWEMLNSKYFKNKYEFTDTSLIIRKRDDNSEIKEFKTNEDSLDNLKDIYDKVYVEDYFLFAKVPNPYSRELNKYNCILLGGTGTISTGYAVVTAGGKQSIRILYKWFKDKPFEIVGKIEMEGWFDGEKRDPVNCIFDGDKEMKVTLLPNAITSPQIFDNEEVYTNEDFLIDMEEDPIKQQ